MAGIGVGGIRRRMGSDGIRRCAAASHPTIVPQCGSGGSRDALRRKGRANTRRRGGTQRATSFQASTPHRRGLAKAPRSGGTQIRPAMEQFFSPADARQSARQHRRTVTKHIARAPESVETGRLRIVTALARLRRHPEHCRAVRKHRRSDREGRQTAAKQVFRDPQQEKPAAGQKKTARDQVFRILLLMF